MKRTNWIRFPVGLLALAASLGMACGPQQVSEPPDAGGASDGGVEQPVGPPMISGKAQLAFRDIKGVTSTAPIDLYGAWFQALYPSAGGEWQGVPGVGGQDGTFEISQAAEGEYWLRIFQPLSRHEDAYILTDAQSPEVDVDVPGRQGIQYDESQSTVFLLDNVDGFSPWESEDGLGLISGNLGLVGPVAGWAAPGETSITAATPWAGNPLPDPSKGDDLMLLQYRHAWDDSGTFGFYTAVHGLDLSGVTLTSGEINHIQGTLTAGPDVDYPLHWKRSAFAALQSEVQPNYAGAPYFQTFASLGVPGGADRGTLNLLDFGAVVMPDVDALSGYDDLSLTLHLTNPIPQSWWLNTYQIYFPVELPVPGDPSQAAVGFSGGIGVTTAGLPGDAPVEPLVSPPRELKINGKPLTEDQQQVGLTPSLSWTAPATGTAHAYLLSIYQWDNVDDGVAGYSERAILMIPGDVTQVKLPPNILRTGRHFFLNLEAIYQPGVDVRVHGLFEQRLPYGWADTVSNTFSP